MNKAISYYRASTEDQEQSGLGLEAQKQLVQGYAALKGFELVIEFTEIESGANNKRPVILKAIQACKKHDATLLISSLDRLARSVFFIAKMIESGIRFITVDSPDTDKLMTYFKAIVAENERDKISIKTKAALAVLKQRGVELGRHGKYVLSVKNREAADAFAMQMRPFVDALKGKGITTIRSICKELNRKKVPTFYGKYKWHVQTVYNMLKRLKSLENKT